MQAHTDTHADTQAQAQTREAQSHNADAQTAENTQQPPSVEASAADNAAAPDSTGQSPLEAQLADANDRYTRLLAEFENYKRRTLAERERLLAQGGEALLLPLLPVLDDIDRALKAVDAGVATEKIVEGIRLVQKNYLKGFEKLNIQQLYPLGQAFDSEYHEAIANVPAPEGTATGTVIEVVQCGYQYKDKVIRFAKVVVAE